MFETLKRLLLEEILEQVEYADKVYDEISEIENELKSLSEPEYEILLNPRNPDPDFNVVTKILLFKEYKKQKKEYEQKIEEYNNKRLQYEQAMKEYETKKEELEKRLEELKLIWESKKLEEIRNRYNKIKEANNIKELGYSFNQIQELFKQKNIPIVIDETDEIIDNESNFDKLEDLVLVHKTGYAPTNDEIKTTTNSNAQHQQQIEIGGTQLDISFNIIRDTVHFAVNGEVGSHFYGSWDGLKYAIIIPFTDVPNIISFSTGDTYTKGNVDISKGYLLCPEEEVEQIKKNNPNLTIIGYKGENVDEKANAFITMLGYKKEKVCTHGWENKDSEKALDTVLSKTYIRSGEHSGSTERIEEDIYTGINQFIAIIEQLLDKKVDYDVEQASYELMGINRDKRNQLLMRIDTSLLSARDGEIFTEFLDRLKTYGINIPAYIYDIVACEKYYDEKINEYDSIPDDAKEYLEKYKEYLKKSKRSTYNSLDYFEKLFVYEILKQVKELSKSKENIEEKHGLEI